MRVLVVFFWFFNFCWFKVLAFTIYKGFLRGEGNVAHLLLIRCLQRIIEEVGYEVTILKNEIMVLENRIMGLRKWKLISRTMESQIGIINIHIKYK